MKKVRIAVLFALVLSLVTVPAVFAAGTGYDSTTDPVITLSYVNDYLLPSIVSQIEELSKKVDAIGGTGTSSSGESITALEKRISALESKVSGLSSGGSSGGSSSGSFYTAVYIAEGKTILAPSTSIELILRSGTAVIVSPFSDQGVSDFTSGLDLMNGAAVNKNHNLLIPRAGDGRGIKITSAGGAYVMIRGEYSLAD